MTQYRKLITFVRTFAVDLILFCTTLGFFIDWQINRHHNHSALLAMFLLYIAGSIARIQQYRK